VRLLLGAPAFGSDVAWTDLAERLPGWSVEGVARDRIAAELGTTDVLVPVGAPVPAAAFDSERLGLVQQYGVGVENIDVDAAAAAGVWVCRLPSHLTGNAESVAELAVLGVLACLRRLDEAREVVRTGSGWNGPAGRSLLGSTTVLVGLGAIGTAIVERLRGFGTRLLAVRADPSRGAPDGVELVVGPERLGEVLARADVVVCAAMAGPDTEGLLGADAFAAVRPGAVVVNVSRGSVVDEVALLAALDSGRVASAALDVHAREPVDPGSALVRHPRVLATPHVGGVTLEMFRASNALVADNVRRWQRGEVPSYAVNRPPRPRPLREVQP
jgi:phosphoglycerate dehydrogenase-like enzyme